MTDSEKDVFCEEAASLKARSAELRKEALARQTEAYDSKASVGSCIQPDLVDESYAAMKLLDDSGSEFVSVKALGQGTYGYVHKIIKSVTGEQFAAKVVHAADSLQDLGQEHLALMAARSPNVVAAFGYLTGKDGCVALLLELADLDLSAWLIANKLPSPEAKSEYRQCSKLRWTLFLQVVYGVTHLRSKSFLHLDIKPANTLIFQKGAQATIKLSDLGLSQKCKGGIASVVGKSLYAASYRPPECVFQPSQVLTISYEADIFALGRMFFEMLSCKAGVPLFADPRTLHYQALRRRSSSGNNSSGWECFAHARDKALQAFLKHDNTAATLVKDMVDQKQTRVSARAVELRCHLHLQQTDPI